MARKTAVFGKRGITYALTAASLGIAVLAAPAFAFQDKAEEQAATGFNVRVVPYIAGPYAVGPFEVYVPMSAELLAAIKAEYRDSFALPTG